MKRLNQLIDNIQGITLGGGGKGDLFPYLREFFSRDDVKRRMIEINQHQLFDLEQDRNGKTLGTYTHRVSLRKIRHGLPSTNYTFYETSGFYRSMNVEARDDEVIVTTEMDGNGMDIDSIGRPYNAKPSQPNHIARMMSKFNPSGSSLGLQDEGINTIIDETNAKQELRDKILEHLKNG